MSHDAFVSHSSRDKLTADATVATLESRGIRCWVAPRDVVPGIRWADAIVRAIRECRLMVLVFSSQANDSEHILREVELAANHHKPIIPLRVDDTLPCETLDYYISGTHWLDAIDPPLEAHLERLSAVVQGLLDGMPGDGATRAGTGTDATAATSRPDGVGGDQGSVVLGTPPPVAPAPDPVAVGTVAAPSEGPARQRSGKRMFVAVASALAAAVLAATGWLFLASGDRAVEVREPGSTVTGPSPSAPATTAPPPSETMAGPFPSSPTDIELDPRAPRSDPLSIGDPVPYFYSPELLPNGLWPSPSWIGWDNGDDKPDVVAVWTTSCPKCLREMRVLGSVMSEYPDVGFVTVLTHLGDQDGRSPEAFMERHDFWVPMVADTRGDTIARALGARPLPFIYFISVDGRVVRSMHGEVDEQQLRDGVEQIS